MPSLSRLDYSELHLEERSELAAWRAAAERRLFIEFQPLDRMNRDDDEYVLHLLVPDGWRCIAVRRSWSAMRRLVEDCRPIVVRRLIDKAKLCTLHPRAEACRDA